MRMRQNDPDSCRFRCTAVHVARILRGYHINQQSTFAAVMQRESTTVRRSATNTDPLSCLTNSSAK